MSPATTWKEIIPEGESARFERYAEQLRDLQRRNAASGLTSRALHAKGKVGLEAEFTALPDLPEHARIGMFGAPASYRALVRFSNGSGRRQHDKTPDVRGVAIKVLGVAGKKIIPGLEDKTTQDFLLIRTPTTPFRDAAEFIGFVVAARRPALAVPRILAHFGLARGGALLKKLAASLRQPTTSLATTRYYSAVPIKYGPYAVHYALEPHARAEGGAKRGASPDHLGEELEAQLARGPVIYDFRVQFYVDDQRTPIEDASVEWKEQDAPFVTVARLTLPQQDVRSARGRRVAELIEGLSFDPWHAGEDFRPLGDIMRARNHAYRLSTQERGASPEPEGTELP
jgi:hypothetical protein